MTLYSLARWALARVVSLPWFWLWFVLLGTLGPGARMFFPLATTTRSEQGDALVYELAFLAILAGAIAGSQILQEAPYVLAPLDPLRRIGVETAIQSTTVAAFLVAGLVPLMLMKVEVGSVLPARLAGGVFLTHLHVLAVSVLLLRIPIPPTARLLLLPALVWVVPAILDARTGALGWVVGLLDSRASLSRPGAALERKDDLLTTLFALRPTAALFLAAALLRPPTLPHALRHPG